MEHTAAILGEAGLFNQLEEPDIYIAKLHQSGGSKSKITKYWAIGVHLPEKKPPHPSFSHAGVARIGTYTYTLRHSTTNTGAAHILAEQLVRPSNWTYDEDASTHGLSELWILWF